MNRILFVAVLIAAFVSGNRIGLAFHSYYLAVFSSFLVCAIGFWIEENFYKTDQPQTSENDLKPTVWQYVSAFVFVALGVASAISLTISGYEKAMNSNDYTDAAWPGFFVWIIAKIVFDRIILRTHSKVISQP